METESPVHAESDCPTCAHKMANAGVIDLFAHDRETDEVLLVMNETRPWEDDDEQLHEVQEKFNAYASFVLDGEMLAAHPELSGKRVRIELHATHIPQGSGLELLQAIHDQLEHQEIKVEVLVRDGEIPPNEPQAAT